MLTFSSSLAFLDGLGGPEMLLIFIMSLMLFGGKKLPELARSVGKTVREFKRAAAGVEDEIRRAMDAESPPTPAARPKPPSTLPAASAATVGAATTPDGDETHDDYHDEHHHDDYHHEEYSYDHDEDHKDLETTSAAEEPKIDEDFEAGEAPDPASEPPAAQPPAPEKKSSETDSPPEDSPESPKRKA